MRFIYSLEGYPAETLEPISSVSVCLADRMLEQLGRAIMDVCRSKHVFIARAISRMQNL